MPSSQLLRICAALLESRSLRRRLNEDPEGTMAEFGLDADEMNLLYRMDAGEIAKEVVKQIGKFEKEVEGTTPDAAEFPPAGEEYTPEPGSGSSEYPTPKPGLYRVRPSKAKRTEIKAAGEKLEIVITGKSFRRGIQRATVVVQRLKDAEDNKPRVIEVEWTIASDLYGTFRNSRLVAHLGPRVGPGSAETTIKAADYRVVVENGPDPLNPTKKLRLETKNPRQYDFTVMDDEP